MLSSLLEDHRLLLDVERELRDVVELSNESEILKRGEYVWHLVME